MYFSPQIKGAGLCNANWNYILNFFQTVWWILYEEQRKEFNSLLFFDFLILAFISFLETRLRPVLKGKFTMTQ